MARQGCRHHRFVWQGCCLAVAFFGAAFNQCITVGQSLSPSHTDRNVDLRLELRWESATPRIWAGELGVADDPQSPPVAERLSEPGNLTPGMLLTGGIQLTANKERIRFSPPPSAVHLRDRDGQFVSRKTTRGGISFRVVAPPMAHILVSIHGDSPSDAQDPLAIRVQDLIHGAAVQNQVGDSGSWTIRRVEGDRLRVALVADDSTGTQRAASEPEAGTALFWDDQPAQISVSCDADHAEGMDLVCDAFAGGVQVVATQSWPIAIEDGHGVMKHAVWQPPLGDGSYELRWRLQRKASSRSVMGVSFPSNLSDSFTKPMSIIRGTNDSGVIAESKLNVVVLSRRPQGARALMAKQSLNVVGRIEPFGRSWSASRLLPIRQAAQLVSPSSSDLKKSSVHGKTVAELRPGNQWQQPLPVSAVGVRHRIVLHLPDGQAMRLGIRITDRSAQGGKQKVIRDVTCVRTRLPSGASKWATAELDYYPQSTSPQLTLINRDPLQPAVFEAVDISAADPAMMAANSVEPDLSAEMKRSREALMFLELTSWLEQFGDRKWSSDENEMQREDVLTAALRLVDSVRGEGYSGAMLTVYEDGRSLYRTASMTADRSGPHGQPTSPDGSPAVLELLMRLFDRESLALVPCIRPNFPLTRLENAIASGSTAGRGIAASTPWSGQSLDLALSELESYSAGLYNPLAVEAADQATELVRELAMHCQGHRCVQTIGVIADEGSFLRLPPPKATMDVNTLNRFHASLSEDTISRSQLIGWIDAQGAAVFEQWRADRLRELYGRMIDALGDRSRNLMVISTTQQPPTELLHADPQPQLLVTRLYRRGDLGSLAAQCRDEAVNGMTASPRDSWNEKSLPSAIFIAPESHGEAVAGDATSHSNVSPLLDPISTSLSLTKLLGRGDRRLIAFSASLSTGANEVRRRSLARFQYLPAVTMEEVAASDEAMKLVKLRRVVHEGATYFAVTNHCRWPMVFHASLSSTAAAQSVLSTESSPIIGADGTWQTAIEAGELVAVRVPGEAVTVRAWSAQLAGGATQISDIGLMVRELASTIAAKSEPSTSDCIENAGFEEVRLQALTDSFGSAVDATAAIVPHRVNVAGWLMAQHTEGCAAVDQQIFHEGKCSIRLRNEDGRPGGTWILSRAIQPPASGRIAVSLMLRGEPTENAATAPPIIVRIAIEGTVGGNKVPQSKLVEVNRNGQWGPTPCQIVVDSLPRCGVESLRLAIDVMNEGTVWIDSVKAYEVFMTDTEKSQLQSQMFLALGGLTKGELSHTARLLESHWIQYRLGMPLEPPKSPRRADSQMLDIGSSSSDNREAEVVTPGLAERLRGWLPRPIRF